MKRLLLSSICCLCALSAWALPQGGGFFNIGKDEGDTTLEQWFSVDSHWSAAAQLPGVWADVQGSPNTKQTSNTGNVFGVPAARALVERDAQGVIVAVIVEFDPTKQAGGAAALVKRLTTSVGVYQGNTTWTARLNDKVNVGKAFIVTLHQEKNLVSLHLAKAG